MRRVLALGAALALVVSLAGSSLAAGSIPGTSRFVGSFDTYFQGQLVGHINAVLVPTTDSQFIGGSYSTSASFGSSVAIPTEVRFYHQATYNKVWFNGLEVGTGQGKTAFTGHFVDYFDHSTPDTVEFWGQTMAPVTAPGRFLFINTPDNPTHYFQTVKGVFVLIVR